MVLTIAWGVKSKVANPQPICQCGRRTYMDCTRFSRDRFGDEEDHPHCPTCEMPAIDCECPDKSLKRKSSSTDDELVEAYIHGDHRAFGELSQRHYNDIVNYARRITNDADEAKSIAQEAIMQAMQNIQSYTPGKGFRQWLFGITANISHNYLRDRTRHARVVSNEAFASIASSDSALEQALHSSVGQKVREAIDKLPQKYRDLVHWVYIEGRSTQEYSEKTGIAAGTIWTMMDRARRQLRDLLSHEDL